ncbi:hypothetical protein FGG08_005233 [Glutinoglossum americanum]|uniref:Dynamin family protein n=1 Tax=Glutinoglossum americanum TaxID=1670608 RepID=A0A9P8I421_9PEZI|nr:hypothetical protein FGG08_005233 [Glutinoglossum americanum]
MALNGTISRLDSLQASEQLHLLDEIDKLRLQGISEFVFLPQLIVCGDQSSGKSSVLEAISGIPFPRRDSLCTRFATELILRKSRVSSTSVSIVPSGGRPEPEGQILRGFAGRLENLDDLPALIDRAKIAMGVSDIGSAFSKDVLRVELSGPTKPHLTIVDLPGLIHSENRQQSADDVELVSQLVSSYMKNPRTIILAVVSAMNDIANQVVLKRAKEVDHEGVRTLGLITKPDTLPQGSEREMAFVNLAKNDDVEFRLGWHVLRNRDYHTRESTMEARDEAETEFFSRGAWSELRRDIVGISTLRSRLSSVLFHQIKAELPSLIRDVQQEIGNARAKLSTLGKSRSTLDEQRVFLVDLSQTFSQLCKASCDGVYDDSFFGDSLTDIGYIRRLRAVVQNNNLEFAETMKKRGHCRDIQDRADTEAEKEKRLRGELPEKISRKEALDRVRRRLTRSRGRELPGTFNPLLIGELFHEQASPWRALATEHLERVWKATKVFLEDAIKSLTDLRTYDALFRYRIDGILEEKLQRGRKTLDRLMEDCDKHPITYNHYFIENLQKSVRKRREEEVSKRLKVFFPKSIYGDQIFEAFSFRGLLDTLLSQTEADIDTHACIELLDLMEAYYEVALKKFVDDVAVQAVEDLIGSLWSIFYPPAVATMDADLIEKIAAETPDVQEQRLQLKRKLDTLQKGMETLKRHVARGETVVDQEAESKAQETEMPLHGHEEDESHSGCESVADPTPVTPETPVDLAPANFEATECLPGVRRAHVLGRYPYRLLDKASFVSRRLPARAFATTRQYVDLAPTLAIGKEDNLIVIKAENERGMMSGLGKAKGLGDGPSRARQTIRTIEFIVIEVLKYVVHTYRHDLESLFYAFPWVAICHGQKRDKGLPKTSRLRG